MAERKQTLKIASWNVNSITQRLPAVLDWLATHKPDALLLQELKCQTEKFPMDEVKAAGYQAAVFGQKAFNGVAILSPHQIENVTTGLAGDDTDEQARYIEATIQGVRVASIYLPNGNPTPGPKYDYKLGWMDRLQQRIKALLQQEQPLILGGD